jgi:hypothetical protein
MFGAAVNWSMFVFIELMGWASYAPQHPWPVHAAWDRVWHPTVNARRATGKWGHVVVT